jgi:UDP-glucose 4-epimerase
VKTIYKNNGVLVTGGLGFLGSNLAIRLVELGACVTVVDSQVRGCGSNLYNLAPVRDRVEVIRCDIGDEERIGEVLAGTQIVFNLAGEISHIHSMRFPMRDAELNATAQLGFLEQCANLVPGVRIVYAGTRQIYGVPEYLPVDEKHPISPVDFNGIHNYSAVMYHLLYSRYHKVDAVVLNFTNLYGPRIALSLSCQGFLGNFLRKLITGRTVEIFGDGRQLRDPMYVDDAVDVLLMAGAAPTLPSRMYNVGGPEALELRAIAEVMSRIAGVGPPVFRPFPNEQKQIDIGSYVTDGTRIQQELGWAPETCFEAGIKVTFEFFRAELSHYLSAMSEEPSCMLDPSMVRNGVPLAPKARAKSTV